MLKLTMTLACLAAGAMLATAVQAENPYKAPDNSWISLGGTVAATTPTAFELDYGTGLITVEMDGWSWYASNHPVLEGDKVIVYGRIDDDFHEIASIEANSVYVRDLNTYFYANDSDGEEVLFSGDAGPAGAGLQLQGTIVATSGREFTLDTGSKKVKVDTLEMPYNPMDDKGYQQLKTGDFVQVSGELDVDFFEQAEIMAKTVTTLVKDSARTTR